MGGSAGSCATRHQMAQRTGSRFLALGGVLERASRTCRVRLEARTSPTCTDRLWSHQAEMVHRNSRMLKNSASGVLASFRPSTYRTEYASAQATADSPTRRRAQTWRSLFVAPCASLRPCPRNGASWRDGVGRVRSLNFLSILREYYSFVPAVWSHRSNHLLTGAAVLRLHGDR